jgi:hypothetical protein
LIVMPATDDGNPASSTPMRATFHPLLVLGIGSRRSRRHALRVERRHLASTLFSIVREHRVGPRRRSAPRGALPHGGALFAAIT